MRDARRRVPQAVPLHRLNEDGATWLRDRVSLAGVMLTILGLYVLGVLGIEVLR